MYVISVTPALVRRMRPGEILASIVIEPGMRRARDLCESAALEGPFEVRYHPDERLANGRSLSIHCPSVTAISAEAGAAQLAAAEASGRATYVHANTHRARANAAGQLPRVPIIAIRRGRYARPEYASRVRVNGPGWLVACPERMLPCSAKVYLVIPHGILVEAIDQPGVSDAPLHS